jgi:protein LSM14
MAKLDVGKAPAQPGAPPMNANLQQRIDEMRDEQARRGGPGHRGGSRGGRGGRGGSAQQAKLEIPATDFDFASANAKFNKMDSVKEAIATGSPLGEGVASPPAIEPVTNGHAAEPSSDNVVIPPAVAYNKSSSFFDNISSELKDREDSAVNRGQQFRTQERAKNMETFGQGSVDGFRGGYRGRGRGRGRGGRGRGFGGGFRGGRGRGGAFGEQQA